AILNEPVARVTTAGRRWWGETLTRLRVRTVTVPVQEPGCFGHSTRTATLPAGPARSVKALRRAASPGAAFGGVPVFASGGVSAPEGIDSPWPVNWTSCTKLEPSPLISQVPEAAPVAVGAKRTLSTRLSPGAIVVSSGSELVAANSLPSGGLDLKIVIATPPVFDTVNDRVASRPTTTPP